MGAIIAIGNHKGGVGKTVTAVNLAARLARMGKRTLLVDIDPQAHATLWFEREPQFDLHDVIKGNLPTEEAIVETWVEGLQLLPATLALARLDMDIISMPLREFRIQKALNQVRDRYDFIVLDLAPSLSAVTVAALVASTHIIAPVTATKLALAAYGTFRGFLTEYQVNLGVVEGEFVGVLLTMVDPRTRVAREVRSELAAAGHPLFTTQIPRRISIEDQIGEWISGDKGGDGDRELGVAYDQFAGEVLERLGLGVSV